MKGLLRGNKFNKRHQTVIPAAIPFLQRAKAIDAVSKISIGIIRPCNPGPVLVKYKVIEHAIQVKVRGVNAVQSFYVYGKDLKGIKEAIEQ